MKTIAVIGSGYVGVTTAALAANAGYKVHLIDLNPERIKILKEGRSFFYENGIDPLLEKAVKSGNLIPSTDYAPGMSEAEMVFSCVGTPDNPDGTSNLSYVFSAAETAAKLLKPNAVYVQKSTVPVGTGRQVIELLPENIRYVSNPEFLREGSAVNDTLYFDRIVVGSDDKTAANIVIDLYKDIENVRSEISKLSGLPLPKNADQQGQYIATNLESAELIKVTANAFLALKISFANSIAKLADKANADVVEVMDAVGADRRIGRDFLNAGRGYGGGCFPKDVSGLIGSAADYGVDMPIMTAAQDVNESMAGYIANKAQELLGNFDGKKLTVLGLAFKAGTSDSRRSPGVKLANLLSRAGATVSVYDPKANGEAREELRKDITIAYSSDAAVKDTHAVFIATDWPEFKDIDIIQLEKVMSGNLFMDCMNCIDVSKFENSNLNYVGVGR